MGDVPAAQENSQQPEIVQVAHDQVQNGEISPETKRPEKSRKESSRISGKVKWFNAKYGYGFITREDTNEDIFVHFSGIARKNPRHAMKSLGDGELVEFNIMATSVTGRGGRPVRGNAYVSHIPRRFDYQKNGNHQENGAYQKNDDDYKAKIYESTPKMVSSENSTGSELNKQNYPTRQYRSGPPFNDRKKDYRRSDIPRYQQQYQQQQVQYQQPVYYTPAVPPQNYSN